MGQIKQFTRTKTSQQLITTRASANQFVNTTGLEAQAQALGQAGATIEGFVKRQAMAKQKQDQSEFIKQLSDFKIQTATDEAGFATQDFEADDDLGSFFQTSLDERAGEFAQRIPASMQQRFENEVAQMGVISNDAGIKEQARRIGVRARNNFTDVIQSQEDRIRIDPTQLDDAMSLIAASANSFNLPAEDIKALVTPEFENLKDIAIDSEIRANPAAFLVKAQQNPGQFSEDKIKSARGLFEKEADLAEIDRLARQSQSNVELSGKQVNGSLTYGDVVNYETVSLRQATTDAERAQVKEFADFLKEDLDIPEDVIIEQKAALEVREAKIKRLSNELKRKAGLPVTEEKGTITNTDKALAYGGFIDRIMALGAKEIDDKPTKLQAKKQSLATVLDLQADIMKAGQTNILSEADVTNLLNIVMPAIEQKTGRGFIPGGERVFESSSIEPFSPAFTQVLDHLKKTPLKDTPLNQSAILQTVLGEVRDRNIMEIQNPQERVDAFDEAINSAISTFETARIPALSVLGGARPNAILRTDGTLEDVSATDDVKADRTLPDQVEDVASRFRKTDGGFITKDQILETAKNRNISPQVVVRTLRASGVIE